MADADAFHGDEAVAPGIVLTAELDACAVGADASDAFTVETCLAFWTNDRTIDAPLVGVATVGRAEIAVVAANRRPRANATGAGIWPGARVTVIAAKAIFDRAGETFAASRITGADVALIVESRAIDRGSDALARRVAGVRLSAGVTIVARNARLRNRDAGARITGANVALIGQPAALRIEAAIGVDKVAMIGNMLVQRVRADRDDVVRIRSGTSEMANGDVILGRSSRDEGGQRRDRASQHTASARRH